MRIFKLVQDHWKALRWKTGFCRRLRKSPPVFVYQMGKVSSRSVYEPLRGIYPGEVLHDHVFDRDNMQGETRELVSYMRSAHPPEKIYLISLVRDPIARNVSAFFANFIKYTGQSPEANTQTISQLKDIFLQKFPHDQPLTWYDYSIKPHFGIDVYSKPFPPKGSATYSVGPYEMLVMRMENDDADKSRDIRNFLCLPQFEVTHANVTGVKACGDLYRQFRSEVRFDPSFTDMFCESRYFQHFYSREFIENTRRQWTEGVED